MCDFLGETLKNHPSEVPLTLDLALHCIYNPYIETRKSDKTLSTTPSVFQPPTPKSALQLQPDAMRDGTLRLHVRVRLWQPTESGQPSLLSQPVQEEAV